MLASQLEQLQTSHDALVSSLQKLSAKPSEGLINTTVECCLPARKGHPQNVRRSSSKTFPNYRNVYYYNNVVLGVGRFRVRYS